MRLSDEAFFSLQKIIELTLDRKKPSDKTTLINSISQIIQPEVLGSLGLPKEISDVDKDQLFEEACNYYLFESPKETSIIDPSSNFDYQWLHKRVADYEFKHAKRYFDYLSKSNPWKTRQLEDLKKHSLDITSYLGNPKDESIWLNPRKGLLIGDVQAGKTANYTAVINRAADIGYQVVIVLAGSTENLRQQTQERLDKEFAGFSNSKVSKKIYEDIGVGIIDSSFPKPNVYTSMNFDYNRKVASSLSLCFDSERVSFFVIKKNKTVLEILAEKIADSNKQINGKVNLSLLLIDDEADYASVNTNPKETDPTAINQGIQNLLKLFARPSYLAVTATPYANIFIDDQDKNDLFPSDYIYIIPPSPVYFGADRMFLYGQEADSHVIEGITSSEMEGTYKFGHKNCEQNGKPSKVPTFSISQYDDLPKSMLKAIRYFFLAQCAMDFLHVPNIHRTMMINVTRFIKRQVELRDFVQYFVDDIKTSLTLYGNNPSEADNYLSGEFYELKQVWNEYCFADVHHINMSWDAFCPFLVKTAKQVRVAIVNLSKESKGEKGLNYLLHPEGDRVIAVGGLSLSRGLTLEGLVVSYFYRNAQAYDTLLQMCRWFGYRDSYLCVFKVWMGTDAIDWYSSITNATNHLKDQISLMSNCNPPARPSDVGLAVRHNPAYPIIITALGKMRGAQKSVEFTISNIQGYFFDTGRLFRDEEKNKANERLINRFVVSLPEPVTDLDKYCEALAHGFWVGIKNNVITKFLSEFKCAFVNNGYKLQDLNEYFIKNFSDTNWDVAICPPGEKEGALPFSIPRTGISSLTRKRSADIFRADEEIIRISGHRAHLAGGADTQLGLTKIQRNAIKQRYADTAQTRETWLRIDRNPLLILYPLSLYLESTGELIDGMNVIWGLGIGIPSPDGISKIRDNPVEVFLNPTAIRKGFKIEDRKSETEDEKE